MKRTGLCMLLLLAACLALAALACGSGGGDSAPTPTVTATQPVVRTLEGEFTIMEVLYGSWGQPCEGEGGYADIQDGTQVVVRDGTGRTLGTGELVSGNRVDAPEGSGVYDFPMYCQFEFTVSGLPQSDFYAIEVGHRGELTYSYADLDAREWKVELTLGED